MDSLPPDPYVALGVAKDATAAAIKQQYRKLVLRLHPDKVQDDALKQAAADEFHKVQTAYEIVSDDDRRHRYDAQCRLAELRRDVVDRDGGAPRRGPDVRAAGFKVPTESGEFYARGPERSGHMSPRYEERRPNFDYFEPPRTTSRKDPDFDRPSKRAPMREDPKKSKPSSKKTKENERSSRDERARQSDRDVRKERERKDNDRKFAFVNEHSPISDSDDYDRARRPRRDDEDGRKARAAMEEERRKEEEATASFFGTERTQKMFNQDFTAREYMSKGSTTPLERPVPERRPSPVRKASSREKVEYIDRKDGRPPVMIRRGSGAPEKTRDPRKTSSRDKDIDIVEEPEEMPSRRPPTLNKTHSSPVNIRPPFERQRSSSLQFDPKDPPIPGMKRAETMPYPTSTSKGESRRTDPSKLRTEIPFGYPTPEVSPERQPRKGSAGQLYAEESDYRTEVREPVPQPRYERSPSPMGREPQPQPQQTPREPRRETRRQYSYQIPPETADPAARRPSMQRESSSRALFGEVPNTRSPRPEAHRKVSPPMEDVSWVKRPNRMEDVSQHQRPSLEKVRMASGSNRARRSDKGYSSSRAATPVR